MPVKNKGFFPAVTASVVTFGVTVAGIYTIQTLTNNNNPIPNTSITKIESESEKNNEKSDADVSLQYAGSATLFTDEKIITLNFANPSKSKKSLSLEIIANINEEDVLLAKSDIIHPGYKIESIEYAQDREIQKGDYKGKFIVHFYDERDNEEVVNSEIAINIHVK
jgi:hypothetical protein